MHRCWYIPELITQILDEYASQHTSMPEGDLDKEGLQTLAVLARTCRAMHDPALNMLWYKMQSLSHLVKLLPQDMWVINTTKQCSELVSEGEVPSTSFASSCESILQTQKCRQCLTHARCFVPEDWARFDHYACRIRTFVASPRSIRSDDPPRCTQVLLDVLYAAKNVPLLPKLRSVSLQVTLPEPTNATKFVLCVAPPALTEIRIRLTTGMAGPQLSGMLHALAVTCPAVQKAGFQFDPQAIDLDVLAGILELWRELRGCVLQNLPHDFKPGTYTFRGHELLCALSTLPYLNALRLDLAFLPASFIHHREGCSTQPLPFRPLRSLFIRANDTVARQILQEMAPSHLEEFEVVSNDLTIFSSVSNHLKSCTFTHALQRLVIFARPLLGGTDHNAVVSGDDLKPLLHLHGLRDVTFTIVWYRRIWTIETCDDDWEVLARAWPLLRSLTILDGEMGEGMPIRSGGSTHAGLNRRRPTLRSLLHLARHCPELKSVTMTLAVDASVSGIDIPVRPSLTDLSLRMSTVPENLFYSLSGAKQSTKYYGQYTWEEVTKFICSEV